MQILLQAGTIVFYARITKNLWLLFQIWHCIRQSTMYVSTTALEYQGNNFFYIVLWRREWMEFLGTRVWLRNLCWTLHRQRGWDDSYNMMKHTSLLQAIHVYYFRLHYWAVYDTILQIRIFFSIFEMFYGCDISEFRTGKILLLTTHLSLLSWVGSGESTRHIYLARRASGRKYEPK